MALHEQITTGTGFDVFFCDPHSPWQRGLNENTNGLLRQYFPKRRARQLLLRGLRLRGLLLTCRSSIHNIQCHHSQCPSRRAHARRVGPETPFAAQPLPPSTVRTAASSKGEG